MEFTNRIWNLFPRNGKNSPMPKVEPEKVPDTSLEQKQQLLAHHVRMVARDSSYGLFVAGPGGLGKSRTIQRTLQAEGIVPVLVNSHVTPLGLYRTLFENRKDRIVWLDDCDSIYANLQVLGILRSALWGQGARIVTYTSSQLDGLPNRFAFDSKIIFCANTIPNRNQAFRAVLSRVDVFNLTANADELLELMRSLAARGHGRVSADQCLEVVEFIEQQAGSRQLSMRLYEQSIAKVTYALANKIDWKELVRSQLDQIGNSDVVPTMASSRAIDLEVLAEAVKAHPDNVQQQEEFWCARRKKSRASFFRCKQRFEEQAGGGP